MSFGMSVNPSTQGFLVTVCPMKLQRRSNSATHSVPPIHECVVKQGGPLLFSVLRVVVVAVPRATTVVFPTSGVVGLN